MALIFTASLHYQRLLVKGSSRALNGSFVYFLKDLFKKLTDTYFIYKTKFVASDRILDSNYLSRENTIFSLCKLRLRKLSSALGGDNPFEMTFLFCLISALLWLQ